MAYICLAIAVLIPTLVAGLRDVSIGTDTHGYISMIYNDTLVSGQNPFELSNAYDGKYQVGYLSVAQIARIWPDINAFLIFTALICFGVAVIAIRLLGTRTLAYPYLIYLLMNFNESMNNSRQEIAMSFGLLAAVGLVKKLGWVACVGFVGAFLFHKTAVILVLLVIIYAATEWRRTDQSVDSGGNPPLSSRRVVAISACLGLALAFVGWFRSVATDLLLGLGLQDEYGIYLIDYRSGIPPYLVAGQIALVVIFFVARRNGRAGYFYFVAISYGAILFCLTGISVYLFRLSAYFSVLTCLASTNLFLPAARAREIRNVALVRWAVFVIVALQWYLKVVIWNNNETYPYLSTLL